MTLKLISLNVNGMAEKPKRTKIFNFLRMLRADIYFLQETHNANQTDENNWGNEWGGPTLWSRGTRHSKGVAIFIHPRVTNNVLRTLADNDGRIIAAKVAVEGIELNLMNIYAPIHHVERRTFFNELWRYQTGDMNLAIAGDFNCATSFCQSYV